MLATFLVLGDNAQAKSLTWTPGQIVSYRVSCSPSCKLSSSAQEGAGCRISAQHQPISLPPFICDIAMIVTIIVSDMLVLGVSFSMNVTM